MADACQSLRLPCRNSEKFVRDPFRRLAAAVAGARYSGGKSARHGVRAQTCRPNGTGPTSVVGHRPTSSGDRITQGLSRYGGFGVDSGEDRRRVVDEVERLRGLIHHKSEQVWIKTSILLIRWLEAGARRPRRR
jgi:hypothetical protein